MHLKVEFSKPLPFKEFQREDFSLPQSYKKSFVPQWVYLQEALPVVHGLLKHAAAAQKIFNKEPRPILKEEALGFEPLKEDLWSLAFWATVVKKYGTVENLYEALSARRKEIEKLKNKYRYLIENSKSYSKLYETLASCSTSISYDGTFVIDSERLSPISDGISGSYFLSDNQRVIRFVVKPIDEDGGCLNNRKGAATPFEMSPFRDHLPLYRSAFREAVTYQIAASIGVGSVAPRTVLAILQSDSFYDLSDGVFLKEMSRYEELCGKPDREKLCSVQEFVPNAKTLFEALQELQSIGLSDAEIAARFDQGDFEDANILLWTTCETDGHSGNFLVYPKGIDEIGNEILGLKKIDNAWAFPDKNKQLRNHLTHLPNAQLPLSEQGKAKIAKIDAERLSDQLRAFGLESAIPALKQRISLLKEYAARPGITLKEINKLMSKIGNKQ